MKYFALSATALCLGGLSLFACQQTPLAPSNAQQNARLEQFQANYQASATQIAQNLGETLAPNEAAATREIEQHILATLKKNFSAPPMKRDVHAKHHGCVKAQFQVQNQALPPAMRVGVFAQNQNFPAWLRFSNGGSDPNVPDTKGDIRGLAIKLMGVPGKKLLPTQADARTQDFVMMNNREFFIEELKDYVAFSSAVAHGGLSLAGFAITHPRVSYRLYKIFGKQTINPLESEFFSATAYQLGNRPIKFKVRPCQAPRSTMPAKPGPNYLREAMAQTLKQESACMELMVQPHSGNFEQMPVENATVEWPEQVSAYVPVARITMVPQSFDSPAQMQFCENLSFTPWHSLPEHRPLGVTNRVRKSVYELISEFRHRFNQVPRQEPEGFAPF